MVRSELDAIIVTTRSTENVVVDTAETQRTTPIESTLLRNNLKKDIVSSPEEFDLITFVGKTFLRCNLLYEWSESMTDCYLSHEQQSDLQCRAQLQTPSVHIRSAKICSTDKAVSYDLASPK